MCIAEGSFPLEWGLAGVTLSPKTEDFNNVKNWKPIYQFKLPSRIIEMLVRFQLSNNFESICKVLGIRGILALQSSKYYDSYSKTGMKRNMVAVYLLIS